MAKRVFCVAIVLSALALVGFGLTAEEAEREYVGDNATRCKLCHKAQVEAWLGWPMATALDRLDDAERANPECVVCHVTGFGEAGGFISEEETPAMAHVQCEACHGPASAHLKATLTDKEHRRASIDGHPSEDNCLACHSEERNPNFKGFDFEEAVAALEEHLPEVPEKQDATE